MEIFHTKCDGIPNTITILKAKSGNIFGGFTEQNWDLRSGYVKTPMPLYSVWSTN